MRGDDYTGVSLQTMDEAAFDHGIILAQTPPPGLRILDHPTLTRVKHKLAMEGADLLVQGLRDGVHLQPYVDAGWKARDMEAKGETQLQHAPKIAKSDTQVDWTAWTAKDWRRRLQMSQAVWTMAMPRREASTSQRLIFHDAALVPAERVKGRPFAIEVVSSSLTPSVRSSIAVRADDDLGVVYLQLHDDTWVRVRRARREGRAESTAKQAMKDFLAADSEDRPPPE